jgi:outer membrane protein assembly factor BamB
MGFREQRIITVMKSLNRSLILLVGIACCVGPVGVRAQVSFVRDIAPVLLKRCTGCHGEKANLGGYRAHTFQYLMKAGASGQPEIVPNFPEKSTLYARITTKIESIRMPKSDDPLAPAQIQLFRRWIAEGAKFDGSDPTAALKSLLGPRQHPAAPVVYRASVPVMALAFTPDGQEVAVGGYNEITFWNAATGALVRRIGHLPQRIQALAYSRDGKSLLVAGGTPGEYGEVARIDLGAGPRIQVFDTFPDIALAAAFSVDGRRIAAGSADGGVRAYDWTSGKRLWTSRVHADWVTGVSFSYDGKLVASASKDMTVKLYEAETGSLFTTYNGHNRQLGAHAGQAPVYAVQFSPDSPLAYSAGGGTWIQVWDPNQAKAESGDAGDMEDRFAKESKTRYIDHGFAHEVFALAVQDGQIFAASADGVLKQFDLKTLQEVRAYRGPTEWMFALSIDAASHRVAAGSYNGEVHLWDTQTGKSLAAFRAQPGATAKPLTTADAATRRTR